ncbi:MAG: FAD-dependent oxidoreductase [Gemmatimonadaceae bacterium]
MRTADVVVLGGGLIGLAVATAAAARGASVLVLGEPRLGEASPAGAGMLAPGAEGDELGDDAVRRFALAGRDMYPTYVAALEAETGLSVYLDRNGILELMPEGEPARLPPDSEWVGGRALRALEPALASVAGAVLHPDDGSVDNVMLYIAMRRRAEGRQSLALVASSIRAINVTSARPRVILDDGDVVEGSVIVVATGAWASHLEGLPRPVPVRPVRGQLLMMEGALARHVIYGGGGYLVPRLLSNAGETVGRSIIGATMEEVGFDSTTTQAGLDSLNEIGRRISPSTVSAHRLKHWAGLRPITPDRLPILGPDPDFPSLLYACGHGRNGILLAPITGEAVGALAAGERSRHDLTPFSIERFATAQ